jgi:hypothetical protein
MKRYPLRGRNTVAAATGRGSLTGFVSTDGEAEGEEML